jgi:hypothetical protein
MLVFQITVCKYSTYISYFQIIFEVFGGKKFSFCAYRIATQRVQKIFHHLPFSAYLAQFLCQFCRSAVSFAKEIM